MSEATAAENADWLRDRFAEIVVSRRPASVADVGSGAGQVALRLRSAGVDVVAVEADEAAVAALAELGLESRLGTAERLPLDDAAVDLIVARHVPHHLLDVRAAFAQFRRAARGAVVAEPWFDLGFGAQRVGLAFDEWIKALHRRQGRVHGPNLDAAELLAALGEPVHDVSVHRWSRPRARPIEELFAEAEPVLADVGEPEDRSRFDALIERARREGITHNGSVAVAVAF